MTELDPGPVEGGSPEGGPVTALDPGPVEGGSPKGGPVTELDPGLIEDPPPDGGPVTAPDPGLIEVTCPECGATASVRAGRRAAGDFCPSCDYPLFWARPQTLGAPQVRSDDALRRLPGAAGAVVSSSLGCPECAELNLPNAVRCVRCGALMTPPPPPPEPALPAPVVVVQAPAPPPEPCGHPETWVVVLITAVVTVLLTLLIVWMV